TRSTRDWSSDVCSSDLVGARRVREHQVAVGLVGVGALRPLGDLDQALVDAARVVLEATFDEQIAGAMIGQVPLQRVQVEVLPARSEERRVGKGGGRGGG